MEKDLVNVTGSVCTSLRKASIEHGMAIVSITVTTTKCCYERNLYDTQDHKYKHHRGLDSDMGS